MVKSQCTTRVILEYACSVWNPYTKENITQLEQVQRGAARYVTNRFHNTSSIRNMIEHLNWQSLADRRSDARLVMLYKISHELVAAPKTDKLIPPFRLSRNMHSFSYYSHSHTKYHQHVWNSRQQSTRLCRLHCTVCSAIPTGACSYIFTLPGICWEGRTLFLLPKVKVEFRHLFFASETV